MREWKVSPSAAIACIALFFALGGSALAAHHYLISSESQIKPSVLQALHGRSGAQGTAGPAGPVGPTGPTGPQGLPGQSASVSTSALTEVDGSDNEMPAKNEKGPESELEGIEGSVAECPAGERVVSGSMSVFTGSSGAIAAEFSIASADRTAWIVLAANGGNEKGEIEAIAYCAGAAKAVVASARRTVGRRVRAEEKALISKFARRLRRHRGA